MDGRPKKTKLTIDLEPQEDRQLEYLAFKSSRTKREIVRVALARYMAEMARTYGTEDGYAPASSADERG